MSLNCCTAKFLATSQMLTLTHDLRTWLNVQFVHNVVDYTLRVRLPGTRPAHPASKSMSRLSIPMLYH